MTMHPKHKSGMFRLGVMLVILGASGLTAGALGWGRDDTWGRNAVWLLAVGASLDALGTVLMFRAIFMNPRRR
jgi:hypothetical protein